MKTENQIWNDVRAVINTGLSYFDISGFSVQQSSQPSRSTVSGPTIWIDRVSSKRYGIQSDKSVMVDGELVTQSIFLQEIIYQITAAKKRTESDTVNTSSASDALNYLATFFNSSVGVRALAEKDFESLWVTEVREPSAMGNSELFEKFPSFDITLVHKQTVTKPVNHVEAYFAETVPV